MSKETWQTFRDAIRAKFAADIAAEGARAEALRNQVVPALREVVAQARAGKACDRVWLFGSFAWGEPNDASDIDLLIEGPAPDLIAREIIQRCRRMVHAITLAEAPSSLVERAMTEGIAL